MSSKNVAKNTKKPDIIIGAHVKNNMEVLEYSRTCSAVLCGFAAGILGLTSLSGVFFYIASVLLQAVFWYVKADFKWQQYLLSPFQLLTHSIVGGFFTYVLAWVFANGLVHVY
uniref:ER membrane protein complex subunit 6 n=1 Tax=Rhabditophanes sp. KR3021 TaxID=114890 RepID=A0AC35UI89_9BILA